MNNELDTGRCDFDTEKVIEAMVRGRPDGVILDERFAVRERNIEVADFLFSASGLVIELKCITGGFISRSIFQQKMEKTLRKFDLPQSVAHDLVFDENFRNHKARQYFWSHVSRPAEGLIRKAVRQLKSTKKLIPSEYKNGALFVAVDGGDEASIGQLSSIFYHVLSKERYSEIIEALVIFSSKRVYQFSDGSFGSFWLPGYAPGKEHLGDVIDPLIPIWKKAIDDAFGSPSIGEAIKLIEHLDIHASPRQKL